MNHDHVIAWAAVPESIATGGLAKRVIAGAHADLTMVRIAAGTRGVRHSHPHEQFVQVASGSGQLETEQGLRKFGPGDVFHFPADAWHIATFDADTVLIETNLYTAG